MTREEAKQWLEAMKSSYALPIETYEAIDLAIESLSADTVSRSQYQGLLNAIGKVYVEVVQCKDCKHRNNDGWCDVYIQPRMETDFCNHGERQCNYFGERREP